MGLICFLFNLVSTLLFFQSIHLPILFLPVVLVHFESLKKKDIIENIEVKITGYYSTNYFYNMWIKFISQNVMIILLLLKVIQQLKDFEIIVIGWIFRKATLKSSFISDLIGCSEAKGIETHRHISYFGCRQILTVFLWGGKFALSKMKFELEKG